MSISNELLKSDVIGSMKCKIFKCTFTSVTGGKISTGLQEVYSAHFSNETSDNATIVYPNYSDAGSTASRGDVYVDVVTSNDVGTLTVFGF